MYLDPFTAIVLVLIGIVVCTLFVLLTFIIAVFVNSKFTVEEDTDSKSAQTCETNRRCIDMCPLYETIRSPSKDSE